GDTAILNETVIYRHFPHGELSEPETILHHVKRALESIKERFLYGKALISYAGGDWDDTLQPANKALKEKLVSSWTCALAYQVINQLGTVLETVDADYATEMANMAVEIKKVFNEELIKDGVIAGFAYCEDADTTEYMLHPDDNKTGIQYRLLPMTRSIISELVTEEQAQKNLALINEHFMCPDGVRLMNNPANYKGGVVEFFQRAEQASNVGREIGLQYVHAHIRYIEAMAKLGLADDVWKGLYTINPINIQEEVPNAVIRQSNAYFSSSDGLFNNRYDFQNEFDKLRTGDVSVKGGWRIYSSGPGIYLNQLVSNVLGFRMTAKDINLDPVIPAQLNGLTFNYTYDSKPITFIYHVEGEGKEIDKVLVNGQMIETQAVSSTYRQSGVQINKEVFDAAMSENTTVSVYMK
ncbi:MAG: GH36-type glycosyl hydrolase domain-containing protein, partial [Turicibacter sp.]